MRALLLQVFYSVRCERQLMEQMRYNLLFRWFVGLAIDDAVWDHSVFSKNRDRLLEHEVVEAFFAEVMALAEKAGLLSKEHFSVDGTLIQAWASHKSFRPRTARRPDARGPGRNAQADWKGKRRSNDTHASTTDPDARLYRKSHNTAAILCYQGHVLMENRSGLVVGARGHARRRVRRARGGAGDARRGAGQRAQDGRRGQGLRHARLHRRRAASAESRRTSPATTPDSGGSAIDGRTTRHTGYAVSQIDPQAHRGALRLGQDGGRIRQTVYRGIGRVDQHFKLTMTARISCEWLEYCVRYRRELRNEPREPGHDTSLRRSPPETAARIRSKSIATLRKFGHGDRVAAKFNSLLSPQHALLEQVSEHAPRDRSAP